MQAGWNRGQHPHAADDSGPPGLLLGRTGLSFSSLQPAIRGAANLDPGLTELANGFLLDEPTELAADFVVTTLPFETRG